MSTLKKNELRKVEPFNILTQMSIIWERSAINADISKEAKAMSKVADVFLDASVSYVKKVNKRRLRGK